MQLATATRTGAHGRLSPIDHLRISKRIAKECCVSERRAHAMLDGAVDFLRLTAAHPGERLVPSPPVDEAWHVLILHTRTYREFCWSLGRRVIDHEPSEGAEPSRGGVGRTMSFMERKGVTYDKSLWSRAHGDWCSADSCDAESCYQGDDD